MRRKGGRVVSAAGEVVTVEVAPSVVISTLDIFSKFQSRRHDFEADWIMLEEDPGTASDRPILTVAVAEKLRHHQSRLAAVRRGAAAAAASSSSATATTSGPFPGNSLDDVQAIAVGSVRRRMPEDSDDEGGGVTAVVVVKSQGASTVPDSDAEVEEEDGDGSEDDVEYVPESEQAKQYCKGKRSAKSKSPAPPAAIAAAQPPPAPPLPDAAVDDATVEMDDGIRGDYLSFSSAVDPAQVAASQLQATVSVPSHSPTGSHPRHPQQQRGAGGGGSSPVAPTEVAASSRSRVVPLWSVQRVRTYGGYCASSPVVALHQEMCDLVDFLRPSEAEVAIRRHIELEVAGIAQRLWPGSQLVVYGSLYTHLLLPLSDVDMTLLNVPVPADEALTLLASEISKADLCQAAMPRLILRTKVPLVKFQHKDSLIDVDISIDASDGKINSDMVIRMMNCYPEARPLIIVIKYFLHQRDMHEPYHGGLGSYATTLLVISFLQNHPIYTTRPAERAYTGLGKLLVDFFRYYGCYWRYSQCGISVEDGGCNYRRADSGHSLDRPTSPTSPRSPLGPPQAVIEDPGNSNNNVASSLRNYHMIASVFAHAYAALTAILPALPPNSPNISPDATDVAHRPTLLSRILHVDSDSVHKRRCIESTFEALCEERPESIAKARLYRRDEDLPMLEGRRAWRVPTSNVASDTERRVLASLHAAATPVSPTTGKRKRVEDMADVPVKRRMTNQASSSSSDDDTGRDKDDAESNASSVLLDVSRPSKRSRRMQPSSAAGGNSSAASTSGS